MPSVSRPWKAEEGRTAGLDALCDAEGLLFALDAAGAGHDSDLLLAADLDATAVDDGICRVEQAVGTLIGSGNTGHVVDPGVGEDVALVDLGGIAHEAKDIVVLAGDEGDIESLLFEAVNDFLEFFLRGPLFGGDDHKIFLSILLFHALFAPLSSRRESISYITKWVCALPSSRSSWAR